MSPYLLEQVRQAIWETLYMTFASGFLALCFGLPLALLMVMTAKGGITPLPLLNRILGAVIDAVRSVPFIVLLVALIPLTRLIVGTSIGTNAAIVPLAISAIPYFARIAELSLREVDPNLLETIRVMGGGKLATIREVLIPESLPGLISGFTVTLISLVGASAMAGTVGGGGLGSLAISHGYQRFRPDIMFIVVVVLVVLVCAIQWLGNMCARHFERRNG